MNIAPFGTYEFDWNPEGEYNHKVSNIMKTYKIHELSDEAQENAIEEYRHRNWVYDESDDTIVAHLSNDGYEFDEDGELI